MTKIVFGWLLMLLTSLSLAVTPNIGIMLESSDISAMAPSLDEKLCILNALQEREGITFKIYDNHRSLRQSAEAAKQMVADKVDLALLPVISDEAIAASTILQQANIPYLTSATSDSVIHEPAQGLSLFPQNSAQAKVLARYYDEHYAERPVAVITDDSSAYSKQLSAQFLAQLRILNLTIEVNEYHFVGDSFLGELPDLSGHVVFAALFNPQIALLYLHLQTNDNVIILGPDSIGVRSEFLQIVGQQTQTNTTKLIFLKNWDGKVHGANSFDFWSIFYQGCRHKKTPTFINLYVYDMMRLVSHWLSTKRTDEPLAVMRNSHIASVITGKPIEFASSGYRTGGYVFYQYQGGASATALP